MINNPEAEAARARSQAAVVANSTSALQDENAQARRARAGERHLRTATEVLLAQLSTPPLIGEGGVIASATPDNVLYIQRAPGVVPETDLSRVREYLRRVLARDEAGVLRMQDPHSILEDLHQERRTFAVLSPAKQVQRDLYSQGLGPAWQPSAAPGAAQSQVPGESASEVTALMPPVPAQGHLPDRLPQRPQPRPAPEQAAEPGAEQSAGQAGPEQHVSGAVREAGSPGALPGQLAAVTATQTLVLDQVEAEGGEQEREGGSRPLALAAGRGRGKAGARNRGGDGGGDE